MNLNYEEKYELIKTSLAYAERRALQWIRDRLDYFNPLQYSDARRVNQIIKPLAELALTCAIANRASGNASLEWYKELAGYVWSRVFLIEAFREHLLTYAAGGFAYSLYGSLRQCGFEHSGYSSRLLELLDTGYPATIEQLPFVKLHLAYSLDNAGMQREGVRAKAAYDSSFLASHPNPYYVAITDAYAITHVIFFLTDFARAESPFFSVADREQFRLLFPRLLAYYVRRQNWDLTAEMLVCLKALSLDQSPVYIDAWLLLLASQNNDGSFAGPEPDKAMTTSLSAIGGSSMDASDQQFNYFFANYHTTLVALLAMLVAMPSVRPPTSSS